MQVVRRIQHVRAALAGKFQWGPAFQIKQVTNEVGTKLRTGKLVHLTGFVV